MYRLSVTVRYRAAAMQCKFYNGSRVEFPTRELATVDQCMRLPRSGDTDKSGLRLPRHLRRQQKNPLSEDDMDDLRRYWKYIAKVRFPPACFISVR